MFLYSGVCCFTYQRFKSVLNFSFVVLRQLYCRQPFSVLQLPCFFHTMTDHWVDCCYFCLFLLWFRFVIICLWSSVNRRFDRSHGKEGERTKKLSVASSSHDLKHAMVQFTANYKRIEIRVTSSQDLSAELKKKVKCPFQEFKNLNVLFMSEGRMVQEMDRWITAPSAVTRVLLHLLERLAEGAEYTPSWVYYWPSLK